jgi:hypothetical protein
MDRIMTVLFKDVVTWYIPVEQTKDAMCKAGTSTSPRTAAAAVQRTIARAEAVQIWIGPSTDSRHPLGIWRLLASLCAIAATSPACQTARSWSSSWRPAKGAPHRGVLYRTLQNRTCRPGFVAMVVGARFPWDARRARPPIGPRITRSFPIVTEAPTLRRTSRAWARHTSWFAPGRHHQCRHHCRPQRQHRHRRQCRRPHRRPYLASGTLAIPFRVVTQVVNRMAWFVQKSTSSCTTAMLIPQPSR